MWAAFTVMSAAVGLAPSPADACSCIAVDTKPPSFEAWPQQGTVPLDAHFWLQRRVEADVGLLANGRSIPIALRPRLGTLFEVVPKAPLPPRAQIELRVGSGDKSRQLLRVESLLEAGGKLPDGGDVVQVEAHDGNDGEPCSNGTPKATIHFAPFAKSPPQKPVPYALWTSLDPAPLVVDRPPDRIVFVDGPRLEVSGGSICIPQEYWLPIGKGGARLAAAKIDTDGTTLPPVSVTFRAALDQKAQRVEMDTCVAAQSAAVHDATAADEGPRGVMEQHTMLARASAWTAIGITLVSLAIAARGLLRSRRLSRFALGLSAVAASLLAVPLGMQPMLERDKRDEGARQADRDAKRRELSACYKAYPRP